MSNGMVVVPLRPGSDGDVTHRPPQNGNHVESTSTLYLEKLGQWWMEDRQEARPGVKYILERLPVGYVLFERRRNNGATDRYLFGHPDHKSFDSPNRFYDHFKHLMENGGDRIGCQCTVCNPGNRVPLSKNASGLWRKSGSKATSTASSRTARGTRSRPKFQQLPDPVNDAATKMLYRPLGRPKTLQTDMDSNRVDEEGTPDVYRNLIDKLKCHGTLDEAIEEPLSLDWRADQDMMPDLWKRLHREPQWVPRVGDVVLFVRKVPQGFEIGPDPQTGTYGLYNPQTKMFSDTIWEAGLVTQAPVGALEDPNIAERYVSRSGVRVEPLPNPNDTNKASSKGYTYVPVESTRPFFLWKQYVGQLPVHELHPTIHNAVLGSATMDLVDRFRFSGKWPDAQIWCRGIHIGSELVAVGDTVRLVPKYGENVSADVLVVKSIRLCLTGLDLASTNDYDEGHPYNSSVWIFGVGWTSMQTRGPEKRWDHRSTGVPKSSSDYGDWYPLHGPGEELGVPFSRVLSRLYEGDKITSWVPTTKDGPTGLDCIRDAVLSARGYAVENDKRITSRPGNCWFWADNRADALDLQTINGVDISKHDFDRDTREWRKAIESMEAGGAAPERNPATGALSLRAFMAPGTAGTSPPGAQDQISSEENSVRAGSSKRRDAVDASDDEEMDMVEEQEEQEIRRQSRVIHNLLSRKSKASVVVD